jgi:Leucine-rich repeat (LRR) protein
MSKQPDRQTHRKPNVSDRVAAIIEGARKNQATRLDLSYENLTVLPEYIGQLTQLQYLNLSQNRLTQLPESLGQLIQLQYLNLSYNHLTELPASLRNLKSLKKLYLHKTLLHKRG